MAKEVIMPKFGFTQETAEVVEWLAAEGDAVEKGDPILEVTTDKVNMEVEAPADGILAGVRVEVGDVVPVTEIIAYILEPGEELPAGAATGPLDVRSDSEEGPLVGKSFEAAETNLTSTGGGPAGSVTPVAARMAADLGVDLGQVSGTGPGGRITRQDVEKFASRPGVNGKSAGDPGQGKIRATPAARRAAREKQVDLAGIEGSGPRGRVQEADVVTAARRPVEEHVSTAMPAGTEPEAGRRIPLTSMRRSIGRNLQHSWQSIPHIMFQADVDMTAVEELLERGNTVLGREEKKVTITALLTRAVAWTLERHPLLNSRLGETDILLLEEINIGVAVALEDGLIVPVIKNANHKHLDRLNEEIRALAGRARQGNLRPDDVSDGTFTISNLGMYGIDRFTAIINPPQAGILAVGRTKGTFLPDASGAPVLRPVCTMTLSADHRVVDGAVAASFMQDLRRSLEEPGLMLF